MHNTYGANNYKSTEGLVVWYEQELQTQGSEEQQTTKIRVTRHATKQYAFVHMTQTAAAACVTAKRLQYTRSFASDTFDEDGVHTSTTTTCKTEITSSVNDDGSRNVSISVNETDVHYCNPGSGDEYINNPASLFVAASGRNYDENVMPAKTNAGLPSYSKRKNLDISQDLSIMYDAVKHDGWTEFIRYATKRMTYVGMKQTVAEACARAKLSQYTRLYSYIESSGTTNANRNRKKVAIGASISLKHDGVFWAVEIAVNETDVKAAGNSENPASLFSTENGRSYEDASDLELVSVTFYGQWGSTVEARAVGSCQIPEHTLADCTFEYRVGAAVDWSTASVSWIGNTGSLTLPNTSEDIYCRLTCASTESETIIAG